MPKVEVFSENEVLKGDEDTEEEIDTNKLSADHPFKSFENLDLTSRNSPDFEKAKSNSEVAVQTPKGDREKRDEKKEEKKDKDKDRHKEKKERSKEKDKEKDRDKDKEREKEKDRERKERKEKKEREKREKNDS